MSETTRPAPPEPAKIKWTESEAATLRQFLDKSPQFLAVLRAKRPKVTEKEDMESRAMSGSEVKGAEHMIDVIRQLAAGEDTITEKSPFIGRENE